MILKRLRHHLADLDDRIEASIKDGCVQLTGVVDDYATKYAAGKLAVDRRRYLGVLNDIEVAGIKQEMVLPSVRDGSLEGTRCDVLVIGGGVTGCAIARELRRHELDVLLVEKGADVASGQSSRNGGVVHVGVNFPKGSQKLEYCVRGNAMYAELCRDLHVPYENKGQVTFARTRLEMLALEYVHRTAPGKGVMRTRVMGADELREYEPCVPEWSVGGLFMGTGGITCPHLLTVALAENSVENGARISLNTAVLGMEAEGGRVRSVATNRGIVFPKVVVNAAGVWADVVAEMAHDRTFTIHPRVGTDIIFDKKAGWMARSSMGKTPFTLTPSQLAGIGRGPIARAKATIAASKSHSKGIGLIHSADGNLLVGPNADETADREDVSTSREVVERIIEVQREVAPDLSAGDVIAYFTGVRSPTYEEDFVVRPGIMCENIFEVAGIQSPGLTAAPAIAVDVAQWVVEYLCGVMDVGENRDFNPVRAYKPRLSELSLEERAELTRENSDYGEIVCRCEEISKGEIVDALRSPVPVHSVDAVKRRVRPGMGRCQGAFCMPAVMEIIAEESGIALEEVVKSSADSWIAAARRT